MPNGGSDCCGTCWFNRRNRGKAGYPDTSTREEPSYCEIRAVEVADPFWTYCANHPHRRPERDPIPIGPVTRYAGDGMSNDREVWIPSPDSEEIRRHLLDLLDEFFEHASTDRYPIGDSLSEVILRQIGEFKERRATDRLEWISRNGPDHWVEPARAALAQIQGG